MGVKKPEKGRKGSVQNRCFEDSATKIALSALRLSRERKLPAGVWGLGGVWEVCPPFGDRDSGDDTCRIKEVGDARFKSDSLGVGPCDVSMGWRVTWWFGAPPLSKKFNNGATVGQWPHPTYAYHEHTFQCHPFILSFNNSHIYYNLK